MKPNILYLLLKSIKTQNKNNISYNGRRYEYVKPLFLWVGQNKLEKFKIK
jgi:hypothetical protein